MDNLEIIKKSLNKKKCTLLGIGPMSKNCVDSIIDLADIITFLSC